MIVLDGGHPGPTQCVQFNPRLMMLASACNSMVGEGVCVVRKRCGQGLIGILIHVYFRHSGCQASKIQRRSMSPEQKIVT